MNKRVHSVRIWSGCVWPIVFEVFGRLPLNLIAATEVAFKQMYIVCFQLYIYIFMTKLGRPINRNCGVYALINLKHLITICILIKNMYILTKVKLQCIFCGKARISIYFSANLGRISIYPVSSTAAVCVPQSVVFVLCANLF